MRTVFVGAGRGCRAVLELVVQQRLATLSLEILGVMDLDPEAPGMAFARAQGWPCFTRVEEVLALPGLELVIELTGIDSVRESIYACVPPAVRVMDHRMARVFWDLDAVAQRLRDELAQKTELEAAIREDRRRLQEILDGLPDAVMVVDEGAQIRRVNRRFETQTGLGIAEVEGERCSERVCRGTLGSAIVEELCPREVALRSGHPITVVQRNSCIGQSGPREEKYFEVSANPIRDAGGAVSVVVTSREVTEQVKLKRETEESARRFRQILDAAHSLITIKDLDGRYQVVNPSAAAFYRIPAERFVGLRAEELFPAELAAIVTRHDAEAIRARSGHGSSHEEPISLGDGPRVLISERIVLTDYRDRAVGLCCVSQDVTEERRLGQELLQAQKLEAVGKLAAGVAHELNNPLTGILTFAEELAEDLAGQPLAEDVQVIVRETLRCRQIVRDLLDFSRQKPPDRQNLPLPALVRRVLALVQKQATFHNVRFVQELDGVGELPVRVDPNQLQQVLLNLVINARDAMAGSGTITLRAGVLDGPPRVTLDVIDTGCGIPAENLGRIFEPFFSTKGSQGNGLGLSAVRSIMEQHGGAVTVCSEAGTGSTFRLTLPRAQPEPSEGER
jgi:PAS domain S-box-containing protein